MTLTPGRTQRAQTARDDRLFNADVGIEDLADRGSTWLRPMAPNDGFALVIENRRVAAVVQRCPQVASGLHLDVDRVLEADLLESLVPFEDAGGDQAAVLLGDGAVEPVGESRLDRQRQLGR
jgi:hypothetical protein